MLHVTIQMNAQTLEYFGVRRLSPQTQPSKSTICLYVVTDDAGNEIGRVRHRYGNKAASLARKVLRMFGK